MKVCGTGPSPCEIFLAGPYPGKQEDQTGEPFSPGDEWIDRRTGELRKRYTAGDELDRFLNGIDLPSRDDIYITNLHKWYKGRDYVYSQEDVNQALPEFMTELQQVSPILIITMGREVTRLFLGDVDITDVEAMPWILPDDCEVYPCPPSQVVVWPLVHVAAGMRNPELSPLVVGGFHELGRYLQGDIPAKKLYDDPCPNPVYQLLQGDDVCRILRNG